MDSTIEKSITFNIDQRERRATVVVSATTSLALNVSQNTGEPVNHITGQILRSGRPVGSFNIDRNSGFGNLSFDNFLSIPPEERREIYTAFDQSVTELLEEV